MESSGDGQEAKQHSREVFESCAEHYATERESLPYFRTQLAIVFNMLAGASGRILDIGCAAGAEIAELRERGFSVVGMDLAPSMLRFARQRFAQDHQVHFCQADIDHLPFPAESMDHVVCLGVFEFLPDYATALREIRRVLRPGGTAVFAIPTAISLFMVGSWVTNNTLAPLWRLGKRLLGRRNGPRQEFMHRNLCVPWRFHALLRQYQMEPQQFAYSSFFIYLLDRFPKLNEKVTQALEPLASIPLLRYGATVHLVSARRTVQR